MLFRSGGGRLLQLTRNFVPVAAVNGYTFLPGGLIMQWGIKSLSSSSSQSGNVNFATANINFPNACFNVSLTLVSRVGGTSSSDNTIGVRSGSVSTTRFIFDYNGNGGNYSNFYWVAIGN